MFSVEQFKVDVKIPFLLPELPELKSPVNQRVVYDEQRDEDDDVSHFFLSHSFNEIIAEQHYYQTDEGRSASRR